MPKDAESVRREFEPQVESHRQFERRIKWAAVGFCLFLLTIGVLRPPLSVAYGLGAVGIGFWFSGVFIQFLRQKLVCPNCRQDLDNAIDYYCPECGKDASRFNYGLFGATSCTACGAALRRSRGGRRWIIRYCTFCSACLAEHGI
jgi:hypothetical protein